jgi:hypothetical protein
MAITFKKFIKGILLKGESSDAADNIEGSIFVNSADLRIKTYIEGAVRQVVTNSQSQALTNKTIDADNNSISNLETDNLKTGVLNTSATLASASDTQIPSALAVKSYSDSGVSTHSALTTGVHGVTGSVVGTSDFQTLTNKTITGADIRTPSRSDVKQGTKANLTTYALTASNGQLCFATDSKEMFQVVDGLLKAVGGGGAADVDALLIQEFDNASLTDFTQVGLGLIENNPLDGTKSARLFHDVLPPTGIVRYFKQTLSVSPKFRGVNMTAALTLRSTASQGNVTIQFRDETNSTDYPAQQLQTNSQAIASLVTTGSSAVVSGFSNSSINSLRVGMSVTGSGVPSGTTIASINTTALTINLSQNATASATVTLRFSDLPRTIQLGFQIPANCSSYSYTISALQEADSPETYVDDIVLKNYWLGMSNQGQSIASLEVPIETDWTDALFSSFAWQGLGTVTVNSARIKRHGSDLILNLTATTGTVSASEARIPLPLWGGSQLSIASNSGNLNKIVGIGAIGATGATFKTLSVMAKQSQQYLTLSGHLDAGAVNPLIPQTGSAILPNTTSFSFEARIPIANWQPTESKSFVTTDLVPAKAVLGNTALDIPKVTGWQGYTPTFQGFGSPTNIEFEWRQVGENVEIRGKFATGTTTPVEARVSLPAGLTSASTNLIPSLQALGTYAYGVSSTNSHGGFILSEPSVTYITFSSNGIFGSGANNPLTKVNGNSLTVVAAGELISLTASIPCAGLSATEEVVVSGTQSALVQEADSYLRISGASVGSAKRNWTFSTIKNNSGSAIQYTKDSVNGDKFTVLESGVYSISVSVGGVLNTTGAQLSYIVKNLDVVDPAGAANFQDFLLNASNYNGTSSPSPQNPDNTISWTGYLTAGEFIKIGNSSPASSYSSYNTDRCSISISKQSSLKQLNVSSDQKITIPTSELRMEGASTRGSTDTAIVRFDNVAKLRGDAFTVVSDATVGTAITMKKAGRLSISSSLFYASTAYTRITKNQSVRSSLPIASEILAASGGATPIGGASWTGDVIVGDVIRVSTDVTPSSNAANNLNLSFQEQDIAVSVTNTLPQFSESDSSVRVDTANGYGSTATKIRRFSNVRDNIGTDIEYTDSATDGASFKVRSSGVYHISYSDNVNGAVGISLNSTELTTNISTISVSSRLALENDLTAGIAWAGYLKAGDIIRPHTEGGAATVNDRVNFTISKVGKPNVTGVDVTPFVNVQMSDVQVTRISQVQSAMSDRSGEVQYALASATIASNRSDIISIVDDAANTRTKFVALKACTVEVHAGFALAAIGNGIFIFKNGTQYSTETNVSTANYQESVSASMSLQPGEFFSISCSTASNTAAPGIVTFSATAYSDSIITPSESFSTDTASLQYVAGTTDFATTIANLATRPVGSYTTFLYNASNNTRLITSTRPTQTDADMNVNGILLYTRAFSVGSSAAQPTSFAIQIGKGLKGTTTIGYRASGRVGVAFPDHYQTGTIKIGLSQNNYNPESGIFYLDAGFDRTENSTVSYISVDDTTLGTQTSAYFAIHASKSPALVGVPQVQPRIATLSDVKASGTDGGTFTGGSYQTRTLNTIEDSTGIVTSLASNQFTLSTGQYYIEFSAPAYAGGDVVQSHKAKIRNITDSTDAIIGSTELNRRVSSASVSSNRSVGNGYITITSTKTFELQHRCGLTATGNGFGANANFGDNEVYSIVKITKVK